MCIRDSAVSDRGPAGADPHQRSHATGVPSAHSKHAYKHAQDMCAHVTGTHVTTSRFSPQPQKQYIEEGNSHRVVTGAAGTLCVPLFQDPIVSSVACAFVAVVSCVRFRGLCPPGSPVWGLTYVCPFRPLCGLRLGWGGLVLACPDGPGWSGHPVTA